MKSTLIAAVAALAVAEVNGHALFQQLWVDGVDQISFFPRESDGR